MAAWVSSAARPSASFRRGPRCSAGVRSTRRPESSRLTTRVVQGSVRCDMRSTTSRTACRRTRANTVGTRFTASSRPPSAARPRDWTDEFSPQLSRRLYASHRSSGMPCTSGRGSASSAVSRTMRDRVTRPSFRRTRGANYGDSMSVRLRSG